jgi:hypothetical protein
MATVPGSEEEALALSDINHIHTHAGDEWVCVRSLSAKNQQIFAFEGRDSDEELACHECAEQIIAWFGSPMLIH